MSDDDADRTARNELERLIDEGHEDAERHGALSSEELDRWLDEARVARSAEAPPLQRFIPQA